MTLKEACKEMNVDYERVVERFSGMEMLVAQFMKKIPTDPNYKALCEAVEKKEYDTVETAAHTLKGLSANLGITSLLNCCDALVQAMRKDEKEKTEVLFEELKEEYKNVVSIVEKID